MSVNRQGIVWIASYPKSGNTWMRYLLTQLLFGDLNSSADLEACIPNVGGAPGEQVSLPEGQSVMLKTHWTWSDAQPLFDRTLGFVYVVRNPFDVMLSFFNFNVLRFLPEGVTLDDERVVAARSRYIDTFVYHRGNPLVGAGAGHGSWIENVNEWIKAHDRVPSVVVRYEDMLSDIETEMERVVKFLGMEVDSGRLRAVIGNSSFEAMRAQEEKEISSRQAGFFYRQSFEDAQRAGVRFMRRGGSSSSLESLASYQQTAFRMAFGSTMQALGYQVDDQGVMTLEPSPVHNVRPLTRLPGFGYASVVGAPAT